LDRVVEEIINKGLQFGGEQVIKEHYNERVAICQKCPKGGVVSILGHNMEGCTICKCPFATKPRWKKYFSFIQLKIIPATCPHPEGNKWEVVDDIFFN